MLTKLGVFRQCKTEVSSTYWDYGDYTTDDITINHNKRVATVDTPAEAEKAIDEDFADFCEDHAGDYEAGFLDNEENRKKLKSELYFVIDILVPA